MEDHHYQEDSQDSIDALLEENKNHLKEKSLNGELLQTAKRNSLDNKDKEDKEKGGKTTKRWRFHLSAKDFEQQMSSKITSEDNKTFTELCRYIIRNPMKNDITIYLTKSRDALWFKQFDFIRQESLAPETRVTSTNVAKVIKELGPGYRILHDQNAGENEQAPFTQLEKNASRKSEPGLDEENKAEDAPEADAAKPQDTKDAPKKENKKLEIEDWDAQKELISKWALRIFKGETIDQIKAELGKKNNMKLTWIFLENYDLLKKAEFEDGSKQLLRKRQYAEQIRQEESEEEGESKPKKLLVKEDRKTIDIPSKNKEKKPQKKEIKYNPNPTDHDLLVDSIAFYKSAAHFNKEIRTLPLFQKELAEFEATLTPKEIEIIEDAMDTGFNPVHYIYHFKIGKKTLAHLKGGLYKKCINTPSLELIKEYCGRMHNSESKKNNAEEKGEAVYEENDSQDVKIKKK